MKMYCNLLSDFGRHSSQVVNMFLARAFDSRNVKKETLVVKALLIIVLFNTAIVVLLVPNVVVANTISNSADTIEVPEVDTDLDPELQRKVADYLAGFSGGFIAQGQAGDPSIKYFIQNPTMSVGFGESIIKILFTDGDDQESKGHTEIELTFPGSELVKPVVSDPIVSNSVYYIGSSVGTIKQEYLTLMYKNIYNNIDLEYTIKNGVLKYNFYVYPGGNPQAIQIQWNGPVSIQQVSEGMEITVTTTNGQKVFVDQNPISFQSASSNKIESSFRETKTQNYGFGIGNYDSNSVLIIDPSFLMYSTFLGGSGVDFGTSIAVDNEENIYVIGRTGSTDFPIYQYNYYTTPFGGNQDVFVSKFSSSGQLLFSEFIGGNDTDYGESIVIDNIGNIYITGTTYSPNFPVLNGYITSFKGENDGFVVKLATDGMLKFSTFLGGSLEDEANDMTIDPAGNIYITGSTTSSDFPMLNAWNATFGGGSDIFVAKFSSFGSLLYSTYLGGSSDESGESIALDNDENAFITGNTKSSNLPLVEAYQSTNGGGFDIYVAKFSASGSLLFATYLGGSNSDIGNGIDVDSHGNVYVAGWTNSVNSPILNPYNDTFSGFSDVYIAKFSNIGSLLFATYFGGYYIDTPFSIGLDCFDNFIITGETVSSDFPMVNAYNDTYGGGLDVFIAKFLPNGSLLFSTFLGGIQNDEGFDLTIGKSGNIFITGSTSSNNFPTVHPFDNSYGGGSYDGYVTKFVVQDDSSVVPSSIIIKPVIPSQSIEITWNKPSYVDYFSQYSVYRSTDFTTYSLIETTTSLKYVDSTVSPGALYHYIVSADYSFGSFNTTPLPGVILTVPSSPSLVVGEGAKSVYLSWNTPSSDGGTTILEYQIYRGTKLGQYSFVGVTSNLYFNDTALLGDTTYYYVVCAVNSVGKGSYSNEQTATPFGPATILKTTPSAPILDVSANNQSVYLTWTAPSSDGGSAILEYQVYRGSSIDQYSFIGVTKNLYFNDTEFYGDTTYYYVVCAINSVGKGVYSNEITAYLPGLVLNEKTSTVTAIISQPVSTVTSTIQESSTTSNSKTNSSPGFEIATLFIILVVVSIIALGKRRKH